MTLEESVKELRKAQKKFADTIEAEIRGHKVSNWLLVAMERLINWIGNKLQQLKGLILNDKETRSIRK